MRKHLLIYLFWCLLLAPADARPDDFVTNVTLHGGDGTTRKYVIAINPDQGGPYGPYADWSLTSVSHQDPFGHPRSNVVYRVGYNTLGETFDEVRAYLCVETHVVWGGARTNVEWYFEFADTNSTLHRKFGGVFAKNDVMQSRLDLRDTQVYVQGEAIWFNNAGQTNLYGKWQPFVGTDGGVLGIFGAVQLRPFNAFGAIGPTQLQFWDSTGSKISVIKQVSEDLVFSRHDASPAGRVVFDNVKAVHVPELVTPNLAIPSSVAPTGVTIGSTLPDVWFKIKDHLGNAYFVPGWTNR